MANYTKAELNTNPKTWIDAYNLINEFRKLFLLTDEPEYVNHVKRKNKKKHH